MRVPQLRLTSLEDPNAIHQLNSILRQITFALNSIEFGSVETSAENIYCDFITVEIGAGEAAVPCSAEHRLKKVPAGMLCVWQDKPAIWYKPTDSTSADTTTTVYYLCNTAATSGVLLVF